jgi:spore coat protein A, manganese oxidase
MTTTVNQCRFATFAILTVFLKSHVVAVQLAAGLSDPSLQPIFVEDALNALDPSYRAVLVEGTNDTYCMGIGASSQHYTGLVFNGEKVSTTIFGYGQGGMYMWPGLTFDVTSSRNGGPDNIYVTWTNELRQDHFLPVDSSIHWSFSLKGYEGLSMADVGVPVVPHLHGGFTDFEYDGHSEAFFTPDAAVVGPFWDLVDGGFTNEFVYDNSVRAAPFWYHDHTLGITRLNVYAGMAGFFFVRDELDTGDQFNTLGLPYGEYELAYAIQDRMFTKHGELFLPAFPGDPTYEDYIVGEGAELPEDKFPGGGPTALAEFFGDHIVVNGKLWPKANVKPREYRLRLLNGCDSRYLVLRFMIVDSGSKDPTNGSPLDFIVIGSDAGFGEPRTFSGGEPLVIEVAGRYDIIVDFGQAVGRRVILQNLAGDAPFGGSFGDDLTPEDFFEDSQTDKIMAWDVEDSPRHQPRFDMTAMPEWRGLKPRRKRSRLVRELALFEGKDPYGRLQPLLGAATGDSYDPRGLFAAYTWFQAITEKPRLMTTEEWYLINFTADAHSMHLHLVNFDIITDFTFTYIVDGEQVVEQPMGGNGNAPRITYMSDFEYVDRDPIYYDSAPKDVVTVLPGNPETFEGRGTVIRAKFGKLGLFAWHCHILSHEDHEMMRQFEVIPNDNYDPLDPSREDIVPEQNWI